MAFSDILELVQAIDTKFGELGTELASKLGPPVDGGTFVPTAIDLTQGRVEYNELTQTGAITFGLSGTPTIGGLVEVNIRGGGFPVHFSTPFLGVDGLVSGTAPCRAPRGSGRVQNPSAA